MGDEWSSRGKRSFSREVPEALISRAGRGVRPDAPTLGEQVPETRQGFYSCFQAPLLCFTNRDIVHCNVPSRCGGKGSRVLGCPYRGQIRMRLGNPLCLIYNRKILVRPAFPANPSGCHISLERLLPIRTTPGGEVQ